MARLSWKKGVTPPLIPLLCGIANVAMDMDIPADIVITAGTNGVHMKGSKHYESAAVDIRTKNFPNQMTKEAFRQALAKELGDDYDVILESLGKPNEHLHAEYDPV